MRLCTCLLLEEKLLALVIANLKPGIEFWSNTLDASDFVLRSIREEYRIPFSSYPVPCYLKNNKSSLSHSQFVLDAISELLSNGCIIEQNFPPFCVNPLTVPEGKKLRLVLDLRHGNSYLVKLKFKYKDLRSLSQMLEQGDWFFTWDLKSGYHHVDIHPDHYKYLGFAFEFDGQTRYFCFTVLPFGLASACYCFTKLLRPLVKRWRSMGHSCLVYLDDGLTSQPDLLSAQVASSIQQQDLESAGFLCNRDKSHLEPMRIGDWLGFVIDTISMKFQIPPKKVDKISNLLERAISDGHSTFRELSRIAGSLMSVYLAVGPIARLLTRHMYWAIESRSYWDDTLCFSPGLLQERRFWHPIISSFSGYSIREPLVTHTAVFSDASDVAFGGFCVSIDGSPVSGMLTRDEMRMSSTFRELQAMYYVLLSYADQLRNKRVKIFTDNQGAARIVSVGSPKPHLQAIALDIFQICTTYGIIINSQWIPRYLND